jgi:hypothetical protein
MRPLNRIGFIVIVFFASGCGHPGPGNVVVRGADTADATLPELSREHARNCDFTLHNPLRISSDWLWRGGIIRRIEPDYPSEARRKRLQGKISVRVLINGNGEVEQACGDGHPLLRGAAEDAALQWVFRTPKINGDSIAYLEETLVFNFVLER